MTHRYTGVIGKKLEGAGSETHQGTARLLVQQCINEINYRGGQGNASRFKILADGTRVRAVVLQSIKGMPPVVRVDIQTPVVEREEERPIKIIVPSVFLAAVWIPEGIVITPTSADAPYGWSAPRRDYITGGRINPPYGTKVAEADKDKWQLNQVIINRFTNNKYLDNPAHIQGLSEGLPEDYEWTVNPHLGDSLPEQAAQRLPPYLHLTRLGDRWVEGGGRDFWVSPDHPENWLNWPDRPGLNQWVDGNDKFVPLQPIRSEDDEGEEEPVTIDTIPFRQKPGEVIYEDESEEWFCHWPEERLYANPAYEAIYSKTNEYRAAVGLKPFLRPLRGDGDPAALVCYEMQRAKILYHNNEELYRPGYGLLTERIVSTQFANCSRWGENLLIDGRSFATELSSDTGYEMALLWRNSPPHYSNMIHPAWGNDWSQLYVAGGLPGTVTATDSHGELDSPLSGALYAQVMARRPMWLLPATVYTDTPFGRVGFFSTSLSPVSWAPWANLEQQDYGFFIVYQGAVHYVDFVIDNLYGNVFYSPLGVTIFERDGVPWFRVFYITNPDISDQWHSQWHSKQRELFVLIRPIESNISWELECHDPDILSNLDHATRLDYMTFTNSGERGVANFSYTHPETAPEIYPEDYPSLLREHNGWEWIPHAGSRMFQLHYFGGAFSRGEDIKGAEVTATHTEPRFHNEIRVSPRKYEVVSNEQEIETFAVYVGDELRRIKQTFSLDLYQEGKISELAPGFAEQTSESRFSLVHKMAFPSGKELILQNATIHKEGNFDDDYFLSYFLYLDLAKEHYILVRHHYEGWVWGGPCSYNPHGTDIHTRSCLTGKRHKTWIEIESHLGNLYTSEKRDTRFQTYDFNYLMVKGEVWPHRDYHSPDSFAFSLRWQDFSVARARIDNSPKLDYFYFPRETSQLTDYFHACNGHDPEAKVWTPNCTELGTFNISLGRPYTSCDTPSGSAFVNAMYDMGIPIPIYHSLNDFNPDLPRRSYQAQVVEYNGEFVIAARIKYLWDDWDFTKEDPKGRLFLDSTLDLDELTGMNLTDVFPMGVV